MARIKLPLKNYITKEMKAGGAVSLISYLAATKPEMLNKIVGDTAIVKRKHLDEKHGYKYIELPLCNNQYEELRVFGKADLEEGDEVSILSIVVMFLDNGRGQTFLRYDARFSEDFSVGGLRTDVFRKCAKMLCDLKKERITKNVTYEGGECPRNDFGIIRGYSDITIITPPYNRNYYCDTINAITIRGYTNASPLSHELIIAEKDTQKPDSKLYDIFNVDGKYLCRDVESVDYGPDYVDCNNRLWIYNDECEKWEEIKFESFSFVHRSVGEGMVGVYKIADLRYENRVFEKNGKKYYFIDFKGETKLEVEDGWTIVRGFHSGKARIELDDHECIIGRIIDIKGNTIDEDYYDYGEGYDPSLDLDKDNWYSMTDGMYGDYPEEGFDGDYEFLGY